MTTRTWRPDGPGSFQAPTGVHRVHDRHGRLWTRSGTRWTCGTHGIRWRVLVDAHGPVTEAPAPPTPQEPTP